MNSLKVKLLFCLLLVSNAVALMAQPNAPANHNLGCSADKDQPGGAALSNVTNINVVLPAGDRTSNVSNLQQQNWGSSNISTTSDNESHTIYRFNTPLDNASGGFYFYDLNVTSDNYIHVAIYAETGEQSVKVRLATSGGQAGTYNQYQVDSPFQPLNQGWNYLNLSLSSFAYDGNNGAENFKTSQVNQVGFVFSTANKNLYVDDIYFYNYDKPIPAANHNVGCEADTGDGSDAIAGATNIQTVLSAGDRKATFTYFEQQIWDGASSIGTTQDANGHTLYKFTTVNNYGNGGFYFQPNLDISRYNNYLHAAIYAESQTKVQIRLATPGGNESGHYEQYQVNSTEIQLNQGWNYLNLPLEVYARNRRTSGDDYGFEYWFEGNQTETFNFDLSKVQQVGFVITEANHSIYADDIYFYELPYTTVDNDGENIDWNSTSGTTDQVKSVFQASDEPAEEGQNLIANSHDKNNATYYGISTEESQNHKTEETAYYFVAELYNPITVSDVEMIWGNGYPKHYEAYAVKKSDAPAKETNQWTLDDIKNLCKSDASNRLFVHDEEEAVSYEPFYNTTSELDGQGNQNADTKYVVIKMWEPVSSTFGFKLDEIHVGAYDDEYYTVDHISAPDMNFETEEYNQKPLTPTARNKRNAILQSKEITSVNYTVDDDNNRYVSIDREGNQANVWASKPGNYVIDVTGTVNDVEVPNHGKIKLVINRDWLGDNTNTKSMIQDLHKNNNFNATSTQASSSSETFDINNISDGSLSTRWSSGDKEASATNQYITIPLSNDNSKEYQIRDLEFVWERAYPATYAVYGFDTNPNITADNRQDYEAFKTANSGRLLYEANLPKGRDYFPYRDEHASGENANGTTNGNVRNDLYDSKYLVVAFKNPVEQQNGDRYGVSLWELYGQAVDMTTVNNLTQISVADKTMYIDSKDEFTVHALDKDNNPVIDKLNDVTFSTADATDGHEATTRLETATDESGATVYSLFSTINGQECKIAEIWDAGNNTYAVRTGNSKIIGRKTYNITATYHKITDNKDYSTTFALTIIKKPMSLLPTSTETNLVFNDGYYVEERLEAAATSKVLTVDLTNVDFTTDYQGSSLANVTIRAPRYLNRNDDGSVKDTEEYTIGKNLDGTDLKETLEKTSRKYMNPNAIYYVNVNAYNNGALVDVADRVNGENVAVRDNSGSSTDNAWYIETLRLFDGYDYAPESPSVSPAGIKAHNAIFYTNLPQKKKSTILVPFDVRRDDLSGVTFYEPVSLAFSDDKDEDRIVISSTKGNEPLKGNNIYIAESESNKTSATEGYAVAMVSTSYKQPGSTVQVSMTGGSTDLSIQGSSSKARLQGAYVEHIIPRIETNSYYLYSAAYETFLPADNDWFDYESHPDHLADNSFKHVNDNDFNTKDFRDRILPFYAYLIVDNSTVAAKSNAARVTWLVDDAGTGIRGIHDNPASDNADLQPAMYDLLGRKVDKSYHGIVIQDGKKFYLK